MKLCVLCRHPVGEGDRHAVRNCPPVALGRDSQKARKKRAGKRRARRDGDIPVRGQAIAGTGVPKGAGGGKG